jgi:aryl-alcohol dehydrogenase
VRTVRGAVLRGLTDEYTLEPVDVDDPGPGEALVRIVGSGMCHTDQLGRSGLFGEQFLPAILGQRGPASSRRWAPASRPWRQETTSS